MLIYQQKETYIEDNSGQWETIFRISDIPSGVFAKDISDAVPDSNNLLSDMSSGGSYSGVSAREYRIVIEDNPPDYSTFKWKRDTEAYHTAVLITGAWQELEDGIKIKFDNITGHGPGDFWTFSVVGTSNIFDVEDVKNDIDLQTGKLAEDELTFTINKSQLLQDGNRKNNLTALQFVLDAQNITNKRYVALFMDRIGSALDTNNLIFAGVILPAQNWEDTYVADSEWAEVLNVIRQWKFTCQPSFENLFDDILFKAKYDGTTLVQDGIIDHIEQEWDSVLNDWVDDASWQNSNVQNRQGYWHINSQIYPGYFPKDLNFVDLVNLNKILRRFADITEQILENNGKGKISIDFDKTEIDGLFRPTRYKRTWDGKTYMWYNGFWTDTTVDEVFDYPVTDNSIKKLKLGIYADESGGDSTDDVSPFISYRNLKTIIDTNESIIEPNTEEANKLLWSEHPKIKTFTDFLYYLALNFGMFLKMYYKSPTEIQIKFISRSGFKSNTKTYIQDFIKSDGKITPVNVKDEDKFYGLSWYKSIEGKDFYTYFQTQKPKIFRSSNYKMLEKNGRRVLLTLSPTECVTDVQLSSKFKAILVPHNIKIEFDVGPTYIYYHSLYYTQGLHTGIYMKVNPISPGLQNEPSSDYWTTAGYWNVDGVDYEKISDYLNILYQLEKEYYNKELNIECHHLCNFSDDSSGNNPHWNKLKLGSPFDYDQKEYIGTSIVRNFKNKTTKIKLQNSDRFTLTDPVSLPTIVLEEKHHNSVVNLNTKKHTANGELFQYNIVILNDDGTVSDARSYASHYGKIYGMACDHYNDSDEANIMLNGGFVSNLDWSIIDGLSSERGVPEQWIYLNKDDDYATNPSNLTIFPLLNKTKTKDLYVRVAQFISENTIRIDINQQWILKV